jgi:hypothetical protein
MRIFHYYATISNCHVYMQRYAKIDALPLSLKSELAMHFHEELTQKVPLFEMGNASFILSVVRFL